jgi:hypothetical protein
VVLILAVIVKESIEQLLDHQSGEFFIKNRQNVGVVGEFHQT